MRPNSINCSPAPDFAHSKRICLPVFLSGGVLFFSQTDNNVLIICAYSVRHTRKGKVNRGMGFWPPIGDSPFGSWLPNGRQPADTVCCMRQHREDPNVLFVSGHLPIRHSSSNFNTSGQLGDAHIPLNPTLLLRPEGGEEGQEAGGESCAERCAEGCARGARGAAGEGSGGARSLPTR